MQTINLTTIPSSTRKRARASAVCALGLIAIASFGCSKAADSAETHLSRAKEYVAAGQYAKAENEYRDVLRLAPTDPVATRELALLYKNQGQLPQAYTLLQKAAELQPDNAEVQVKLGQILLVTGQVQDARKAALRSLEKQPGGEEALILLATTAARLNDVEETRQLIEGMRTKDQDRAGYHLALGLLAALSPKDQGQAEAEFKAALNLDPKSAAAYSALGNLYWSRNDLGAADQAFKAAADTEPQPGPNRLQYANFKLRTGAVPEAKKMLENINSQSPDYLPASVALMKINCAEHNDNDCAARVQAVLTRDTVNFDGLLQDGILNIENGDAAKAVRELAYLSNVYTKNPQVRYQLGRAYLLLSTKTTSPVDSRNAVENADKELAEAINLDPNLDAATLLLAEIKIRKGVAAAAVDLLTPVVKERPQIAQAQYLLATAYLAQQKVDDALAIYRRMTELFPKDPQPSLIIGNILLAQRQPDEARKAFEKAVEIAPDNLPAIEKLVDLDIARQQYATALGRLQKLIDNDKDPKNARVFGLRGKIYLAQRDFAHAEADLSKAIELDPKLEPAYLLLAQLYVATNKQDQAIAKLNAFVEKNDKDISALTQLALLQQQLRHFDAARDAYEKVLSVNPNLAPVLNNLAVIYSDNLGQIDKAYDLAKRARAAAPNDPHIADTFGWIAFKKGDYSEALSALQESASKLPDSPDVQYHVGMAYYMLGQEEPARIALKNAADASGDFPGKDDARKRLSVLAIGTEDPAARTALQNYLNQQPDDPAALTRLAALQQRDGAVEDAIKTYEKTLSTDPAYAPATRALALLYARHPSDDPKAYELTTKARQAYPDDPEIAKALGILDYRRGLYPQSAELLKLAAAKSKDDPELLVFPRTDGPPAQTVGRMQGRAAARHELRSVPKTCRRSKTRARRVLGGGLQA